MLLYATFLESEQFTCNSITFGAPKVFRGFFVISYDAYISTIGHCEMFLTLALPYYKYILRNLFLMYIKN